MTPADEAFKRFALKKESAYRPALQERIVVVLGSVVVPLNMDPAKPPAKMLPVPACSAFTTRADVFPAWESLTDPDRDPAKPPA
jgi:hypothetical protein